ncbi:MAG TPA: rod shape-determining protein MreC [Kribbellaceae bacterium]
MLKELGAPPVKRAVRSAGVPRELRRRRTVLVLLVLASFTLITLDARRAPTSPVDPLRTAVATVLGPLEAGTTSAADPVTGLRDRFGAMDRLIEENERLKAENSTLNGELRSSEYERQRAAELDGLLKVAAAGQYKIAPARVIAIGPAQDFTQTVTIDAGTADGVRADMTVLNGDGLVGRVVRASQSNATVLLITDAGSTVGGRLERTMALGFVTGLGRQGSSATLEFKLVDLRAKPKVGDRLVTWGSRGNAPYVPGVPIGEVVAVGPFAGLFGSTAVVRPFVDATTLDTVGVVVGPPARNPRDAVLPPRPQPVVTPKPTPEPTATPSPSASPAER